MPHESSADTSANSLRSDLEALIATGEVEAVRRREHADAVKAFEKEQVEFTNAINDACSNKTHDLNSWVRAWDKAGKQLADRQLTNVIPTPTADEPHATRLAAHLATVATRQPDALRATLETYFRLRGTPANDCREAIREVGRRIIKEFNSRQEAKIRERFGDLMAEWDKTQAQPTEQVPRVADKSPLPVKVPPVHPLTSWAEIIAALNEPTKGSTWKNTETTRNKIKKLNADYSGPICFGKQRGAQPHVEKTALMRWWNGLAKQFEEDREAQQTRDASERATVSETHPYSRTDTVVPGIKGRVRPSRRKPSG